MRERKMDKFDFFHISLRVRKLRTKTSVAGSRCCSVNSVMQTLSLMQNYYLKSCHCDTHLTIFLLRNDIFKDIIKNYHFRLQKSQHSNLIAGAFPSFVCNSISFQPLHAQSVSLKLFLASMNSRNRERVYSFKKLRLLGFIFTRSLCLSL